MNPDRILMVIEVVLLVWIVVQGEYVRFYERETWRMNRERFNERAKWRDQKRQQQTKKENPPLSPKSEAVAENLSSKRSLPEG